MAVARRRSMQLDSNDLSDSSGNSSRNFQEFGATRRKSPPAVMLAEQFVAGSMDSGAGDFGSGWEWDNVMMLPAGQPMNRKLHAASTAWNEEPVMVAAAPLPPPPTPPPLSDSSKANVPGGGSTTIKHESLELPSSNKVNGVITSPSPDKPPSNSSKNFFLGLSGGGKPESDKTDASNGDAEIGLKLGLKRTFSPDTSSAPASSITTTTNITNSKDGTSGSSPGKKPRGSANHIPRCQVEGCKTDLSSAKDYHRRHKVCAMHSKSAKVSVNSIEQRFCQQCSRFHVLSEFDEGKRSCRRRLAGHNERRRKPQPDPMALTNVLSPYQAGFMRLARDDRLLGYGTPLSYLGVDNLHGKLSWPRFGTLDDQAGVLPGSCSMSRPERFFMLIPPRKGPAMLNSAVGHHGVHQFMQGSGSMGQNLTLSSTSAYAAGIGPPNQAAHNVSVTGMSDSGRALSLLSSQSWTASPRHHDSMEHLMSESRAPYNSQQPATSYGSPQVLSQPQHGSLAVVALDSRNSNQSHHHQQQQQQGGSGGGGGSAASGAAGGGGGGSGSFLAGINNYENHTVLTLLQESELRSLQEQQQHARPTIDLMQMSTTQPTSAVVIQQQQSSSSDFQVLKPYGSGMYDPHQL